MNRKNLLALLISTLSMNCLGQVYVNDVAIDTLNTPYCQLICDLATPLSRATIVIDYGQRFVDVGLNRQKVTGPNRQPVIFNSPIDALNFMVRNGWELVSSQTIGTASAVKVNLCICFDEKS